MDEPPRGESKGCQVTMASLSTAGKTLGGFLVGMMAGSAVNMGLVLLNFKVFFPLPLGVTFDDHEAFRDYIDSLPNVAYVVVFLANWSETVVGGYVAGLLSNYPMWMAQSISALTVAGTVANQLSLPTPLWTWIELPFHPFLAFIVGRLLTRKGKTA